MSFLEDITSGFEVGYEICVLASHCAWKNPDSLVKDVLEAIAQHRYYPFVYTCYTVSPLHTANINNTLPTRALTSVFMTLINSGTI